MAATAASCSLFFLSLRKSPSGLSSSSIYIRKGRAVNWFDRRERRRGDFGRGIYSYGSEVSVRGCEDEHVVIQYVQLQRGVGIYR